MSTTLDALAARVQLLEDEAAVRRTWRDYCKCIDAADWPGLGDIYTHDAVLEMVGLDGPMPGSDGVYRGREDIIQRFFVPAVENSANISKALFATGHMSCNMQVELAGDEATTLAYFFEIVSNNAVLAGTYQHRMRRDTDRWRFKFHRITVRYYAQLAVSEVGGLNLKDILAKPV